jgi:hypothetical protein
MSKDMSDTSFNIWIDWKKDDMPWNEICVKVLEVFGLPGHRYITASSTMHLIFRFKTENDYHLCTILLSEYL